MKTFKKALAVVLCVVMTLTAAPLGGLVGLELPSLFDFEAEAAIIVEGTCGENLTWDLTDSGFLSIKGIGAMFNFSESSPAPWADNISDIKTVYIESGVTTVGNNAFSGCTNLTSVAIPDGIISIGENTFNGCSKLVSITLPESLKSIGENAFSSCNNITEVVFMGSEPSWYAISVGKGNDIITSKVTFKEAPASQGTCGTKVNWVLDDNGNLLISGTGKMHDYDWDQNKSPFSNKTSIKTIVIKDGVTSIGNYAFSVCTGLTSVTIGDSVTSIGKYAFDDCTSLTSVTIPDSVTSIGNRAFTGCTSLTSVTIGDSVTSIGEYAFSGCTSLTSVTIGDSVTSIGEQAFRYCTSLSSVTIPDSVTRIGGGAFYNTGYYQDEANWENGVLYSAKHLIKAKTTISGVCTIKEGTTCIAENAFWNCDSITSISIPDSVTSMPSGAFYDCDQLTKVIIGAGVKTIESSAFYSCEKITDVYYNGGSKDWANITIDSYNNTYLTDAKFHYSYHYITWIVVDNIIVDRIKVGENALYS